MTAGLLTADRVTAVATALAALLAGWAAWSATKAARAAEGSAGAAERSAQATVDLVTLERQRFDVEQLERSPAELSVGHRFTKMFRHVELVVENKGPAAAYDVVVEWLDPQSLEPTGVTPTPVLEASRLAPTEDLVARGLIGDRLTLGVRLNWRDSRGEHSRQDTVEIIYFSGG